MEKSHFRWTSFWGAGHIDLYLSYRAVKDWNGMVDLVSRMSPIVARTVLVREQLGFALNRLGKRDEAEEVLVGLIDERGPSSETNGILGRVYKDQWEAAKSAGDHALSEGYLRKAIDTYLRGFESDWRDAYPGVNAATLMEVRAPDDPRQAEILPVVEYSVNRRLAHKAPDYWDYATRLEIAVLRNETDKARTSLEDALSSIRERWEPETTARNLRLIREARDARGIQTEWVAELEDRLSAAAKRK